MLDCYLSYFFVLDRVASSPTCLSLLLGFLKLVVIRIEGTTRKKFYLWSRNRRAELQAQTRDREGPTREGGGGRGRETYHWTIRGATVRKRDSDDQSSIQVTVLDLGLQEEEGSDLYLNQFSSDGPGPSLDR